MDLICQKYTQLTHLYLADALSRRQTEAMAAHLEACERCRQALAEAQAIADSLREAPPPRAPAGLAAGIKAELRLRVAHRQANAIPARMIGSPAFLAVSSSLVVGAILTFIVITQVVMPGIPLDGQPLPTPSGSMIAAAPSVSAASPFAVARGHAVASAPLATAWRTQNLRVRDIAARTVTSGELAGIPARASAARSAARAFASAPIASFARDDIGRSAVATDARPPREQAGASRPASVTTLDPADSDRDTTPRADPVTSEVVGALIADLVVDRYVHDELARKETALLAAAPPGNALAPAGGVAAAPAAAVVMRTVGAGAAPLGSTKDR